ncbi:hypothetical protein L1049_019705 [Liquidambar formosana]|uniref:Uncharacterized protein n=1 Tax=Liquidambar formosana TaxID=63359 RepID=A0AAP0SC10_LIQFO
MVRHVFHTHEAHAHVVEQSAANGAGVIDCHPFLFFSIRVVPMASYSSLKTLAILALALAFCVQSTLGVFLPKLCETQGENARRGMAEIKSSGFVAPAPQAGVTLAKYTIAPAPY